MNNKIQTCSFVLALALIAPVAHGADDCAETPSHSEQRACFVALAAKTASDVALVQSTMSKRITQLDDEAEVKNSILRHFHAAIEQYNNYRTAQCEFEASTAIGGNGAGDLRLLCESG